MPIVDYPVTASGLQLRVRKVCHWPDGSTWIPLGRSGKWAAIDTPDWPLVKDYYWHCRNSGPNARTFYAKGNLPGRYRNSETPMHTVITGYSYTDHKDVNGLNNRRNNLRRATQTQNMQNVSGRRNSTSRFKGVSAYHAGRTYGKPWQAGIQQSGGKIHLGHYATEIDAARAYDKAALTHFGEFARTNEMIYGKYWEQ
jgi:hypothetical protein